MTPSISINPRTWTLRFKHQRSTILLHVDPLQSLPSVRAELLKAIQQAHPGGKFDGSDIPTSEDEVLLARPADSNNLKAGWEQLGKNDTDLFSDDEKGKGKGAVKSKSRNAVEDCPQGAGLKDGGIVAFKFKSELQVRASNLDGDTLVGEPEKWDVVVPSMEETYGDEDAEMDAR